jgi:hypothetical protein
MCEDAGSAQRMESASGVAECGGQGAPSSGLAGRTSASGGPWRRQPVSGVPSWSPQLQMEQGLRKVRFQRVPPFPPNLPSL